MQSRVSEPPVSASVMADSLPSPVVLSPLLDLRPSRWVSLGTASTERLRRSNDPAVSPGADPGSAWRPPPRLNEFRIVRHLGSGGMGDVYLAHDELLDRPVAVKFIREIGDNPDSKRRFFVEAQAAARLQHPNVLTVHRVSEFEGRLFLVTEYIDGRGLDRIPKPVLWREVVAIGLGLSRGLAAAHRRGVLHRDIKPSNAIRTEDGRVKLVDFGLAKLNHDAAPFAQLRAPASSQRAPVAPSSPPPGKHAPPPITHASAVLGTPAYMAPEIWRRDRATERSDIYSLGALLFELCTGAPPHDGVPPAEREARDTPALAALMSSVDPRLSTIVERCLRDDPTERYATGDDLHGALEALADESDTPVRTLRAAEREAPKTIGQGISAPRGNPFLGLRTFEAEHRALFFGRRTEVVEILERMQVESLVLVSGDYGVGKSSVCRAGVLPAVEDGALGGGRAWSVVRAVPGPAPLLTLSAALAPLLGTDASGVARRLRAHPGAIAQDLRERLGSHAGVVLFVDQLEELVTVGDGEGAGVVDEVLCHLTMGVPGFRLLMTARSASLAALTALGPLGTHVQRALYPLRPMSPEALREAITTPASLTGTRFDSSALVETLVEATLDVAWGLPLLEFVLAELWEARDPVTGIITDTTMEKIGDGSSALARYTDEVIGGLSLGQRAAARRILTKLTGPQGTPICRAEEDLVAADPIARAALHELVSGRIVVVRETGAGIVYELIHLALIEDWAMPQRGRDEPAEGCPVRPQLGTAATKWQ